MCFYANANARSSVLLGEGMNICHGVTFVPSVFSFVRLKQIDYYVKLCLQKHQCAYPVLQLSPGKCDSGLYFSWSVSRHAILKPGVEKRSVEPFSPGLVKNLFFISFFYYSSLWCVYVFIIFLNLRQAVSLWSSGQIEDNGVFCSNVMSRLWLFNSVKYCTDFLFLIGARLRNGGREEDTFFGSSFGWAQ